MKNQLKFIAIAKDKFSRVISGIGNRVNGLQKRLSKFNLAISRNMDKIARSFAITGIAGTAGLVGLRHAITGVFKPATELEDKMGAIQAVMMIDNKNHPGLENLKNVIDDLGDKTRARTLEVGQMAEVYARAGAKIGEVVDALPATVNLKVISGLDAKEITDITVGTARAFYGDAWASQTTRISDVFARTSSLANMTISDIGGAMKYVAGIARGNKESIEDTSAMLAVLANAGINSEKAGTVLRRIHMFARDPTKSAQLEKFGVGIYNKDGSTRKLGDILADLGSKTASMTDKEQAPLLKIFGIRSAAGLRSILLNFRQYREILGKIEKSQGAAGQMAETMSKTFMGSIEMLASAWEGFRVKAIYPSLELLRKLALSVTNMILRLNKWIKENPKITKAVVGATIAFTAFFAAITVGSLAASAALYALRFATGPIGWAIAGVGLLLTSSAALYAIWDDIKFSEGGKAITKVGDKFSDIGWELEQSWKTIKSIFTETWDFIKKIGKWIDEKFSPFFDKLDWLMGGKSEGYYKMKPSPNSDATATSYDEMGMAEQVDPLISERDKEREQRLADQKAGLRAEEDAHNKKLAADKKQADEENKKDKDSNVIVTVNNNDPKITVAAESDNDNTKVNVKNGPWGDVGDTLAVIEGLGLGYY